MTVMTVLGIKFEVISAALCTDICADDFMYDVQFVGVSKTAFFGGEGLFFTHLTGPGRG